MRVLAPTAALSPAFTALPGPPAIRLDAVSRVFGSGPRAVAALDRVSLEVGRGEFVCVVGASGCGKSTLLALVAGLDRPTEGRVEVEGGRPALMFQDAGLLPWLSVARNVDLPLRLRRVPRAERVDEVERLLRLVHLDGEPIGARFGFLPSGHERQLQFRLRQRFVPRALVERFDVAHPDFRKYLITLFHFVHHPAQGQDDLLHEDLARIAAERAMSVVFVTHNVREAVRLGDRVLLLGSRPGRLAGEFEVDIPRPRRIEDPAVGALALRITARLREEMGRHARD